MKIVCNLLGCEEHFVFDVAAYSHIRSQHLDLCSTVVLLQTLCLGSMTQHHRRVERTGIRYRAQSSSVVLTMKERQQNFTLLSAHRGSTVGLVLTMNHLRG